MLKTITCRICNESVEGNPRIKGKQEYCRKAECQLARRKLWYKEKINSDEAYAFRQKECKQKWRKKKPGDVYQKEYRESNSGYTEKNRLQQKKRNKKRRYLEKQDQAKKIVKIDSLSLRGDKTGTYKMKILNAERYGKIVKIDSIIVQLQEYKAVRSIPGQL